MILPLKLVFSYLNIARYQTLVITWKPLIEHHYRYSGFNMHTLGMVSNMLWFEIFGDL